MFNKPVLRRVYPHFLPGDNEIWSRFLEKYPDHFDLVDYDIHIGQGIALDPSWDSAIASMATTLTQRRIDVLAIRGAIWYIVEIKLDPGVSVIGQLTGYRILYKAQFPDRPTPRLTLICNRADADLKTILEQLHISYFVV